MTLEQRFRKASKGMLILFIGQLVGLIAILPWEWASTVAILAAGILSLWGLQVASRAHKLYRVSFWLYVLCAALWVLLVVVLAGTAFLPLSMGALTAATLAYTVLTSVALKAIDVLIVIGTARLFRACGDDRRAKNAELCWKLILIAPIVSLVSVAAMGIALGGGGGLVPMAGLLAVPALLAGLANLVGAILYLVVLWQGYDGLDDAADVQEELRLESERKRPMEEAAPAADEDAL